MGATVSVDLATKRSATARTCSGTVEIEMVERADLRGSWLPAELLMSGGSSL